jgi:hypothetical protein
MIRLPAWVDRLPGKERFGLETLIDLSRLVPVENEVAADVVELELSEAPDQLDLTRPIGGRHFLWARDGRVVIPRSLLRLVTEIGGAAIEQLSSVRDRHGRVPSGENPLVKLGLEREPILSKLGGLLREVATEAAGLRPLRFVAPWPEGKRWAVAITHDLDVVDWWPMFTVLRLAELASKGEALRVVRTIAASARWLGRSPVWAGVEQILRAEAARSVRSSWFVLSGTPTLRTAAAGDVTYDIRGPRARAIIATVVDAGCEIGLHGSFATMDNLGAMREEKERLASLVGRDVMGIRQHYLRMTPGVTHRAMGSSGFIYDATYGFSDRSGFRLGAADILAGWDAREEGPSGLTEVPLTWMDRALSKYKGIEDPAAWVSDALELADGARAVEGLWVGLWHPNVTDPLGFPDGKEAFECLQEALMAGQPHVAPLRELVEWRAARKRVRIRAVRADGTVRAVGTEQTSSRMHLEDANGRATETVDAR